MALFWGLSGRMTGLAGCLDPGARAAERREAAASRWRPILCASTATALGTPPTDAAIDLGVERKFDISEAPVRWAKLAVDGSLPCSTRLAPVPDRDPLLVPAWGLSITLPRLLPGLIAALASSIDVARVIPPPTPAPVPAPL